MYGTLSCNAENCIHNDRGLCDANTIKVSGVNAQSSTYTQCDSFAERGLKSALANVFNVNIAGEIKQAFNNSSLELTPNIQCDARHCVYNVADKCTADYVQIQGQGALTSQRTECQTFRPR